MSDSYWQDPGPPIYVPLPSDAPAPGRVFANRDELDEAWSGAIERFAPPSAQVCHDPEHRHVYREDAAACTEPERSK